MITVEVCNEQSSLPVDAGRVHRAVEAVLTGESVADATISIAVVDDPAMRELNRRYLSHDYNTDVLSFLLEDSDGELDGEIIVSAETATQRATEFEWSAEDEMLLYVIHGTLHLTGYDDHSETDRRVMRRKEMQYLRQLGLEPGRADPFGEAGPCEHESGIGKAPVNQPENT